MPVLFLIGPRGSGKSLAAARLAETFSCRVRDTDQMVVQAHGGSIADIVAEKGWNAFRAMEKAALIQAAAQMAGDARAPGIVSLGVIATGGGIVLDAENRRLMRETGIVAYLSSPAEVLIARLAALPEDPSRPPLSPLAMTDEVRAVLQEREPLYRETAHHVIDACQEPDALARALHTLFPSRTPS